MKLPKKTFRIWSYYAVSYLILKGVHALQEKIWVEGKVNFI